MPESAAWLGLALAGLTSIACLAALTWMVSVIRRDASLADRMWGVFIGGSAAIYTMRWPGVSVRGAFVLTLALAWALRLSIYISRRNRGHGEDRRYREMRARHEPHFAPKSLYLVFGLQAFLAWIVSAPLLCAVVGTRLLGLWDAAGFALAAFGLVFEAVADSQMARFKADPAHAGAVMDRGLWSLSRHPNYFGECCVWWGMWLIALGAGDRHTAWSVVSPALMTVLLLKVSGVSLLEKDIGERRPAYRDYIARTPAFVPRWPRRSAPPR